MSYTVQKGDTLSAIAQRNGVTVQTLFAANGLGWASIIYPGQKIALKVGTRSGRGHGSDRPRRSPSRRLDAEQSANAQLIIRVGRELGVPDRGIAIALGAAMQESSLRNLDWGDRDSLGLFQQRPSAGWGTAEQVRDPVRAARAFFGGPSDPTAGARADCSTSPAGRACRSPRRPRRCRSRPTPTAMRSGSRPRSRGSLRSADRSLRRRAPSGEALPGSCVPRP